MDKTTPKSTDNDKTKPAAKPRRRQVNDMVRSPKISRFSKTDNAPESKKKNDIPPREHPVAMRATNKSRSNSSRPGAAPAGSSNNSETKKTAINAALASSPPNSVNTKPSKITRRVRISTIIIIIVLLVAAAAWLLLPTVSLKFAAHQSNVEISTPAFIPKGYSLKLPVDTEDNKVTLTYKSRQGDEAFTLSQEKSLWDSQAVRIMVEKESSGRFLTTSDRGLTVYTYSGKAAWVNKGVLYQIDSDGQLGSDALAQIASSL